ncbi:MAG: hypothetical protein CVV27_00430 [Candidatus Melainabacteria bacterium HGW-Melainabacteria-1]|nr:MAG: hypothetical protein CVV27_00430 [Candidatus Melainabacteria bacterium HGW-Melainabacteria-1]
MNPIDFLVHQMMLPILEKSYAVTGNYGWAIIFLTVIIRMILLPLTMQSYYSMKEMQKLQPKLKKIQERYKNKPEELNKQMVALYRDHKVNPLGGCLPLLIQMPFLFALYASLIGDDFKKMLAASGDKSFYFLSDLTHLGLSGESGLYFENIALLVLFTLTTVLQQRVMTPKPGPDADPRQVAIQKQMAIMMPIMITSMFLIIPLPTGIFLYLVVSNLIGIGQYAFLNAHSKRRDALAAAGLGKNVSAKAAVELDDEPEEDVEVKTPAKVSAGSADEAGRPKVKKGNKKKKKRK